MVGNFSVFNDGFLVIVVVSVEVVCVYGFVFCVCIVIVIFVVLVFEIMGFGLVLVIEKVLGCVGLYFDVIGVVELNEVFVM